MFVVFEGIDGSGKTTLSNRVAAALRARGLLVAHVREGGRFASSVAQSIRELGRDPCHLAMNPRAELLLYCARDVQLFEEATRPALRQQDVVIADRYFYTAHVLAVYGRGLPEEEVRPIVEACGRGVKPDLVILVDVDPHIARARRRVAKLVAPPEARSPSRKGLAGAGLLHRLRDGYLALAARDPQRWVIIDNSDIDLETLVEATADLIASARDAKGTPSELARTRVPATHPPRVLEPPTPAAALQALLAWVDRRAESEPAVAAWFLGGLAGRAVDGRRERLAERAPEAIAEGLRGLDDETSWQLRERLWARAPVQVARSLGGGLPASERREALLTVLREIVPAEALRQLAGRDDDAAWAARETFFDREPDAVMESLKRVEGERAWAWRERWLAARGGPAALEQYAVARVACESVTGLDDERAWALRRAARSFAPGPALASLRGLTSERAWRWRQRWIDIAPKPVLATIAGVDDDRAWWLRQKVAARAKEAIDSIVGLDGEPAWRLREACADLWPSTVAKSIAPLVGNARGEEMVRRLLARHPGNVSLWKHAAALHLGRERAHPADAGAAAGEAGARRNVT